MSIVRTLRVESVLYGFLVMSLGLGTVTLGKFGTANVRTWEIVLVCYLIFNLSRRLFLSIYTIKNKTGLVAVAAFLFAVLLSAFNAADPELWQKQALLVIAMSVLCLVTSQRISSADLTSNVRLIIYPGVLIAAWGIAQLYLYPDVLQTYSGLEVVVPRARSFFAEANEFSQFLCLPFAFLLALLFLGKPVFFERLLCMFGLTIVVVAQLLSFSRGGLAAFLAELFAVMLFWAVQHKTGTLRHPVRLFAIAGLISIAAVWLLSTTLLENSVVILWDRVASLFSGSDPTSSLRLENSISALHVAFKSVPNFLVGIGFGNLPRILPDRIATTANFVVDVLAETGLLGLISYCAVLWIAFSSPLKILKRLSQEGANGVFTTAAGAYIALVGITIGGLTYATHMLNFTWFVFGLLFAIHRRMRDGEKKSVAIT